MLRKRPRVDYLRGNGADPRRRYGWPMAVNTETEPQTVGELVRFWRAQRRLTQMDLALDANLSTKHLSFVETGRSQPSRQLLVHLAQHLDLPMAERNRLLLAGGFAPPYLEQPYDGEVMQPLRESLSRLLEAHEPNPALIVDGLWNLIEEVESYLPDEPPTGRATQPVVSLDLRTPVGEVSLFTVIATLGAPLEVTAASLAIETFVSMDARSAARLGELAA